MSKLTRRGVKPVQQEIRPPGPVEQLVEKVNRLCGLLERQMSDDTVQQLRESAAAQCEQMRQLTAVLAGMPAALRTQTESLASQRQTLDNILTHATAAGQQHSEAGRQMTVIHNAQQEVATAMQAVARNIEQQSAQAQTQSLTLTQVLNEARARQDDLARTIQRQSRRSMLMVGFTIGLAAASAVFGAIGLYLKLVGG